MEALSVLRHAATGFFGYTVPMALMKRGRVSRGASPLDFAWHVH